MFKCSCGAYYNDEDTHECKYDNPIVEELHEQAEAALIQPHTAAEVGMKFDGEKPRYDLEQSKAVAEYIDVLTFGAQKYAPENWRKVEDADNRYYAAARRHLTAYRQGERLDPESGKHHLAHAMCCIAFMLELDLEE